MTLASTFKKATITGLALLALAGCDNYKTYDFADGSSVTVNTDTDFVTKNDAGGKTGAKADFVKEQFCTFAKSRKRVGGKSRTRPRSTCENFTAITDVEDRAEIEQMRGYLTQAKAERAAALAAANKISH